MNEAEQGQLVCQIHEAINAEVQGCTSVGIEFNNGEHFISLKFTDGTPREAMARARQISDAIASPSAILTRKRQAAKREAIELAANRLIRNAIKAQLAADAALLKSNEEIDKATTDEQLKAAKELAAKEVK